jgi:hypothetical protein
MNEKIKQLAEQAGMGYGNLTTGNGDNWIVAGKPEELDQEKFAKLIVQECANYINERTHDWDAELRWIFNDGSGDMAIDVDDLLNRHFGVEE